MTTTMPDTAVPATVGERLEQLLGIPASLLTGTPDEEASALLKTDPLLAVRARNMADDLADDEPPILIPGQRSASGVAAA